MFWAFKSRTFIDLLQAYNMEGLQVKNIILFVHLLYGEGGIRTPGIFWIRLISSQMQSTNSATSPTHVFDMLL